MKLKYIHILGIVFTAIYGLFVIFLYAAEPRSLEEISSKAISAVETTVSRGQVITGTYTVDQARFAEGLAAFRSESYVVARDRFERADPEKRDAETQFYIAYSYYRQGWGRVSNDDELFRSGLDAVQRITAIDPDFSAKDPDLKIKRPAELKAEFEDGLKVTADDFNPLKLVRERK